MPKINVKPGEYYYAPHRSSWGVWRKGETIDKRNFRKRIKEMDFIEKTELIDKSSSKRGASLYRFNKRIYNEDPNFKL